MNCGDQISVITACHVSVLSVNAGMKMEKCVREWKEEKERERERLKKEDKEWKKEEIERNDDKEL